MDKIIEIDENGKVHRPDAAPPKELRGVFDPGSASDDLPSPPSDAAPVEWWHWVDDNGDDRFVRGDKFPNFDATALYAHPEDAPEPSAPRCPQCNDTGVRVLPVPGFPDECPCGAHPEDAPGGPTRVIPNDEIVGRGWVHIERMSKGHIWMNILGEPYDLKAVRGKITWTAQVGWKALNRIEGETDDH